VSPPPTSPPPIVRPQETPEPSTLVAAGIGLAVAAGWRRWKRQN
jgi:hypothetical protein